LDEHAEGLVDMVRSIKGVEVAASCHEISKETFKISLRSKGNINIESVAGTFGGGGHINASACVIEGDIKTVKDKLTNAIKAVLCN
jgi:phosphoesterase RecJ-like protein